VHIYNTMIPKPSLIDDLFFLVAETSNECRKQANEKTTQIIFEVLY